MIHILGILLSGLGFFLKFWALKIFLETHISLIGVKKGAIVLANQITTSGFIRPSHRCGSKLTCHPCVMLTHSRVCNMESLLGPSILHSMLVQLHVGGLLRVQC